MNRPQRSISTSPRTSDTYAGVAAFLLALTQLPEIRVVGTLYLHDFVAPAVLLFLLTKPGAMASLKPLKIFFFLAGLWLAGAVVTDLIQSSAPEDYIRGWSRIAFLIVNVAVLQLISHGRLRVLGAYLAGSGVVLALRTILFPSEFAIEDPWKFGLGTACFFLVAGLSTSSRIRRYVGVYSFSIVLLALSVFSLMLNSRSAFALSALAGVYSAVVAWVVRRPTLAARITPLSFVAMMVGGMIVAQGLSGIYANAAADGLLGDSARTKYIDQTAGDTSLILGGRPESLVSLEAIKDSPIIGHGSWARDHYYTLVYFQEMRRRGLAIAPNSVIVTRTTDDLIQSHSHILGSWVEAGILSLPFWIWVLVLVVQALYAAVRAQSIPSLIVSLTAMMVLWDTLFSPFASDARIIKAVQICILVAAVQMSKTAVAQRESAAPLLSIGDRIRLIRAARAAAVPRHTS